MAAAARAVLVARHRRIRDTDGNVGKTRLWQPHSSLDLLVAAAALAGCQSRSRDSRVRLWLGWVECCG